MPNSGKAHMILDVHAHYWPSRSIFSPQTIAQAERVRGGPIEVVTDYRHYWANAPADTRVIIFGGKARRSGVWQDDIIIAEQVATDPKRYIGFLSLDLAQPGWREELEYGHQKLKLRGVKLLPMFAGFYPHSRKYDDFWAYVSRHHLPVLLHTGTTFLREALLKYTLPRHLDEVAVRFPDTIIIMAHMGHPYQGEALAVVRKHPNVYTDISALHDRPFQFFQSLMLATEYKVWPKILFGTDYPFSTVDAAMGGLEKVCQIELGGLRVPRNEVQQMIHRDTYRLLFG